MKPVTDVHVRELRRIPSPNALLREMPLPEVAAEMVFAARQTVRNILAGEDGRLLVISGPCSIHDPEAALEYAGRLAAAAREAGDRLFVVMRVYFEKPRTTVGWKGLIHDPRLDGNFDIAEGLRRARRLLLEVAALGLPAATEFLDPIVPQYIADLVSWAAIGARTTESQTHREMASGLSMPIGFKNGTDGDLQTALDAMLAARAPHSFLGIDGDGITCQVLTSGNPWGHLVLRGGRQGSNYHPEVVEDAEGRLRTAGLPPAVLVDCSHANSGKRPERQVEVWDAVLAQRQAGNRALVGMMLESNLFAGSQSFPAAALQRGVSITDACLGWEDTEKLLRSAAHVHLGGCLH